MVNITDTGLYEKRRSEPLLETELAIKLQNHFECCRNADIAIQLMETVLCSVFHFMNDKCR